MMLGTDEIDTQYHRDPQRGKYTSSNRPCQVLIVSITAYPPSPLAPTWRVGGLSKQVISRVIRTLKETLIGVMVPITLKKRYLISPPTLQVRVPMIVQDERRKSPVLGLQELQSRGVRVQGFKSPFMYGLRSLRVWGLGVKVLAFGFSGFFLGLGVQSFSRFLASGRRFWIFGLQVQGLRLYGVTLGSAVLAF